MVRVKMGAYDIDLSRTLLILSLLIAVVNSNLVHKKFEYRYSFKPPYLAQKDGSVPFWEYGGNAIASSENVRIAPSLRSQKGAIWTKNPVNFDFWEVDIAFRISGRGRIGADGLAFWFTQSKGDYNGEVFGSSDKWNGLGIFFDSFDNDNKHNNPYIMAVLNDGTREFDHQSDGSAQLTAGCLRDFRNKPFPTKAKIEYYNNVLTVLFHSGMTNNEQDYEMCFRAENVFLPKNGYFGVSAATGGLADDHDVLHFLTSSLHPPGQLPTQQQFSEDQARLDQEYQEYQKKLDRQKEEYRKEHPNDVKEPDIDDWFETESQREFRQIFQSLSVLNDVLKELHKKTDEVLGRQERTMSLVSQAQAGQMQQFGQQQQQQGGAPPPSTGFIDTIRRDEVNTVLNNQNQLVAGTREIRQFILELKTRTDTILNNQAKAPTAQVQAVGYDTQSLVSEVRDGLNQIKKNHQDANYKMGEIVAACSKSSSGISVTFFLVTIIVHLVVLLGYNIYRDNKDNHSKKFY